jgi:hypothetical protein
MINILSNGVGWTDALILGLIDKRGARVLNGENPADLPIQDPTRYTVAIDLKTANAPEEEIE